MEEQVEWKTNKNLSTSSKLGGGAQGAYEGLGAGYGC